MAGQWERKWAQRIATAADLAAGVMVPLAASAAGGGFGGAGGFQIDPNMLIARYQDQIGFTDDEWSVVSPRLLRVVALQAQAGKGNIGQLVNGLRGRARGGGGGGLGGTDINTLIDQIFNGGQPSLVTTKHNELQAALNDVNTPAQTIMIKMTEYRQALEMSRQALLRAEADLQAVLTVRQEAMLVGFGLLD